MTEKQRLINIGWTTEKAKDAMVNCRSFQKIYRQQEKEDGKSRWTYRRLNANFYSQYKNKLQILLNN